MTLLSKRKQMRFMTIMINMRNGNEVNSLILFKQTCLCKRNKVNDVNQWFATFSVPWPIFQTKLTLQPTLVNKIKFASQNHSVLQKKKKKSSSLGIAVNFSYFCPKIIVFSKKKKSLYG